MSVITPSRADQAAVRRALIDPSPLTMMMGVFAVLLGVTIVLGGQDAWGGPDYSAALQVPGAPESWGWVLAALGILVIVGKRARRNNRLLLFALAGCGFWHSLFAVSFVWAHFTVPGVGSAQAVTYLFLAILYLYRFAIYREPPINLS